MPAITSQNIAEAIVRLVAAEALPVLIGNLIMGNLVNRDFEQTLAAAGQSVSVPIPPQLVANNLAETGTVQTQNPSLGSTEISLSTHAEVSFMLPDVTRALTNLDLMRTYLTPAMVVLAEKIEGDIFGCYPLMTYNAAVGASNTPITEATVDLAERTLFDAKVPAGEPRLLVVTSKVYSELRQLDRFSEEQTSGQGEVIITGQVGRIKDFSVFRSQYVKTAAGPISYNLAFTRNALGLVIRRLPLPLPGTGAVGSYAEQSSFGLRVIMSYNPNSLAQQFTVDVLYGTGVLRPSHGVLVQAD